MKGTITHNYPYFKKGDVVRIYEINDSAGKAFVMNLMPTSYGFAKKDWVYIDHINLDA